MSLSKACSGTWSLSKLEWLKGITFRLFFSERVLKFLGSNVLTEQNQPAYKKKTLVIIFG